MPLKGWHLLDHFLFSEKREGGAPPLQAGENEMILWAPDSPKGGHTHAQRTKKVQLSVLLSHIV
jgi:hypothetical protein